MVAEIDAAKIEERIEAAELAIHENGSGCCPEKDKLLTMLRGVFPFYGREAARPRIQPLSQRAWFCSENRHSSVLLSGSLLPLELGPTLSLCGCNLRSGLR
jgi:hypothetical protein